MARTLSQLSAGTVVWLDETVSGSTRHVPYIYLGLDESGNARLLRQNVAVQRHMNGTNTASYDGCEADVWLENAETGFLSRFDEATLQAVCNTSIRYVDYTRSAGASAQVLTISRRCFLLSLSEEGFGADPAGSEGQSYLAALKTATGKTADTAARIACTDAGTAVSAWMRSASTAAKFRIVSSGGNNSTGNASGPEVGLRPALSVAPNTAVSDEGAESIFLLPEGRRTWWGIEASMSLGTTARRPGCCKLLLPHDSFAVLSVQVCNNYADAAPTWINCADGGIAEFGTSRSGEHWELGVRISAQAHTANRMIGEPAMIVAFDT